MSEDVKVADSFRRKRKGIQYAMGWTLLEAMGFEFSSENVPEVDKCVLIAFPHTSNWDLPLMLGASYLGGISISWLGKHTLFRGFGKPFFSWLGGVPVDRTAPKGMVQQVVDVFDEHDSLFLAIPPEGTRTKTDGWKTGFYYIAHGAGVPIVPSYLDFKERKVGFGPPLMPTGDIEADFAILREFYDGMEGLYPEWTSEVKVRGKRRYVKPPSKNTLGSRLVDIYKSMRPHKRPDDSK